MTRTPALALVVLGLPLALMLAGCDRRTGGEPPQAPAATTANGGQQAPGTGLNGGLGAQAGMSPASASHDTVPGVAEGSANRTSGSSVGNR